MSTPLSNPTPLDVADRAVRRTRRCDIFCAVIDNFGDIGVSWRLARQLATEHGWQVRLWVDDLPAFAQLCPSLDPQASRQTIGAIEIAHWPRAAGLPGAAEANAEVVIEAFACELPPDYLNGMAQQPRRPLWLNLEYLSAEAWVPEFHAQLSPHPRHALLKIFFFPGFVSGTGGLLRERDLGRNRATFLQSAAPGGASGLWQQLKIAAPAPAALRVSLFAYENPALPALLQAWRDGSAPVVCIVPAGRISAGVAQFLGLPSFGATDRVQIGQLTLQAVPFMESTHYDRLLWACDLNFVRGEDSLVRAIWAGQPLVWHIYPQADAAHLPKLEAALAIYGAGLPSAAHQALQRFWQAWNAGDGSALDWPSLRTQLTPLAARTQQWAEELSSLGDLAGNLAEFAENKLK